MHRPTSSFNFELINWLLATDKQTWATILPTTKAITRRKLTTREIEDLTIELSWKSSALEGNSYTLLDTELLLKSNIRAKNKTNFETQMILNHGQAMAFIIDNPRCFDFSAYLCDP